MSESHIEFMSIMFVRTKLVVVRSMLYYYLFNTICEIIICDFNVYVVYCFDHMCTILLSTISNSHNKFFDILNYFCNFFNTTKSAKNWPINWPNRPASRSKPVSSLTILEFEI
jgi:hypothetical protein